MTVGGADADLILDGCLIDIKSTIKARITNIDLYQIIGYALLDYYDSFNIHSLGLYMARQSELLTWAVPELLDHVMGGYPEHLDVLRGDFHEMLMEHLLNSMRQNSDFDHVEALDDMTEEEFEAFIIRELENWPK